MIDINDVKSNLSFGFEQTFTIEQWWSDEGFTATSDTPLKRDFMLKLAQEISTLLDGSFKESLDIWDHMQYETFDSSGAPSFIVTMDPGSIEVKTQPVLGSEVEKMIAPLFIAAKNCGLVPYRNWWYGIRGGTEGGCHVNMGGLTPDTNPLKKDPSIVVKYSAFIHNRPFLHYPFMALDVGPGGNAMRMDEKDGFDKVLKSFSTYSHNLNPQETYSHFEKTNLINDKASYPSLFKFKAPLYLIEDRAVEALREPEDFKLMVELRLKIIEILLDNNIEKLKEFDSSLHEEKLTSYSLWEEFQSWANSIDLNPVPYQRFFDRQFPTLWMGENVPQLFSLKEGRRPRVIKDIKRNGNTIISKTIDTNFKRFEICLYANKNSKVSINFKLDGLEKKSPILKHKGPLGMKGPGQVFYKYFDLEINSKNPVIEFEILVDEKKEKASFHLQDMKWI